jgi:probable HAF family extracellular repeat protein
MAFRIAIPGSITLSIWVTACTNSPPAAPATHTVSSALSCTTYAVTDLGIPSDTALQTAGNALDDDDNVAGNYVTLGAGGTTHAIAWSAAAGFTDLGTLGGALSVGLGVNGDRVVGSSQIASGDNHGFLHDASGMHDLGTLGGSGLDASTASGVNASGVVVGSSRTASGGIHGFRYDNGAMTDLGSIFGSDGSSSAQAINRDGVIVGSSTDATGRQHAAKWVNGSIVDLGSVGTSTSVANAVNSAGDAAGNVTTSFNPQPAVFRNGSVTLIPLLPSFTRGTGNGINDDGLVVGTQQHTNGEAPSTLHGYIYDGSSVIDLNDLVAGSGWLITNANAINSFGQIVGSGSSTSTRMGADHRVHALLLTPNCGDPTGPDLRSLSSRTDGTTVDAPDGVSAGDFLLAALEYDADPVVLAPPPGWTLVADQITGEGTGSVFHALVYSHIATAGEPDSYTFEAPDDVFVDVQVADYTGVTAIDAVAGASATGATVSAPSVTASHAGEMLVSVFIDFDEGDWSTASGMTQESNFDSNSLQDEVRVTAGATGARSASNDASGALAAISILLK